MYGLTGNGIVATKRAKRYNGCTTYYYPNYRKTLLLKLILINNRFVIEFILLSFFVNKSLDMSELC